MFQGTRDAAERRWRGASASGHGRTLRSKVRRPSSRADTPDEWRKAVGELLADTPRRVAMERSARACVLARYSWAAQMKPLVDLCVRLASAPADAQRS